MTFPEFNEYQEELLKQVVEMKNTKGKEYANSESRFANFNRLTEQLGLKNYQIGWIYLAKHLDSIASYCKNSQTFSIEGIQGRIVDAITYLTLIGGMIQEAESKSKEVNGSVFYCPDCSVKFNSYIDLVNHQTRQHGFQAGKK